MNLQTDKLQMIFRKDYEDKTFYTMGMSKKKKDGTYDKAYMPVQFQKDVELNDRTLITIKSAWLSFYKTKENKAVFYIFINEFEETAISGDDEYKNLNVKTQEVKSNTLDLDYSDRLPF